MVIRSILIVLVLSFSIISSAGVHKKSTENFSDLLVLAEEGNPRAQYDLGTMYQRGLGTPLDFNKAVKWYLKSAEQGNPYAQLILGAAYHKGRGVFQDAEEALKWYRLAAKQGLARAQYRLARVYYLGRWIPQDFKKAVSWYKMAASQGLAEAQVNLGAMYFEGKGVAKDEALGVHWHRKAAAQGLAIAEYRLGLLYTDGIGVPQDLKEATTWYHKAAQSAEKKSYAEAFEYYKFAGEKIEQYILKNPTSKSTHELKNGILRIGAYTFDELKEDIIPLAKRKAKAENDPSETALLIGETTPDPAFRNSVLWNVITHYSKSGQYEKAIEFIEAKTKRLEKVQMLFLVAERYHELKLSKQADEILDLAYKAAIESNSNPEWNAFRISKVAQQHLKFGDTKNAEMLFQNALEAAESIEGDQRSYARKDALREIAIGFSKLGKKRKAQVLFDEVLELEKNPTWHHISASYLEAGLFKNALEAAKKEKFPENKATALAKIAVKMAKIGERKRSLEVFSSAIWAVDQQQTDKMARNTAKELLASKHFDADTLTRIDQLIHGIENAGMKHRLLPDLAVAYHGVKQTEKASLLLAEALKLARQHTFSDEKTIVSYAKIGEIEQALSMARAGKIKNSISKSLGEIAAYLAGKWPPESVDALIEEALQVEGPVEDINLSNSITNLFQGVAYNYLEFGNKKRAIEVLDHMLDHWSKQNIVPDSLELMGVGRSYYKAGQRSKGLQYLRKAEEKNKETPGEAKISWWIAKEFAAQGEYDTSISIVNAIEPQFEYQKSVGRVEIAETMIDKGEIKKGIELLSQVFQIVVDASNTPKVWFMGDLGTQLFRVGKIDKTIEVLSRMENSDVKAKLLIKMSEYYFDKGDKEKAIIFLKKIDTESPYGDHRGLPPLSEIARLWEKYGEQAEAQRTRKQERERGRKKSGFSETRNHETRIWIAVSYAKAGFYDEAFKIVQSKTENFLKGVDWIFAGGMWQIIYHLIEGQEYKKASILLSNALELIPQKGFKATFKAPLLQRIGKSYIQMGEKEKGLKLLDEAFAESQKMPSGATFRMIGDSYLQVGEKEKAFRAYFAAVHLLKTPNVNWITAIDLGSIALSLIKNGIKVDIQTRQLLHNIIGATGI